MIRIRFLPCHHTTHGVPRSKLCKCVGGREGGEERYRTHHSRLLPAPVFRIFFIVSAEQTSVKRMVNNVVSLFTGYTRVLLSQRQMNKSSTLYLHRMDSRSRSLDCANRRISPRGCTVAIELTCSAQQKKEIDSFHRRLSVLNRIKHSISS